MQARLTDLGVEKYAPKADRYEVHDTYLSGLTLRVTERGRKSWYVMYRLAGAGDNGTRGKLIRLKVGEYPLMGLTAAREAAKAVLEPADRGKDARDLRAEKRSAEASRSFEAVLDRFVELHVKPNTKDGRFARDRAKLLADAQEGKAEATPKGPNGKLGRVPAERLITDHALPIWRGRLVETISRAEVHDLLDDVVTRRGPALARELRKHLTKMFNWAADRGHLPASPLAGMRRPELGYAPRERVLSMDELRRI
ncbi:MAG TPA: Arm DNA-binding domain-containing protein [Novosphingobium sp.]|nr:Arm DNA-binding domain-containing protein [Novosphingobium sp.]